MKVFGFNFGRKKPEAEEKDFRPIPRRSWWGIIHEAMAGNWQKNIEVDVHSVLSNPIVYACITLIASDLAKMRLRLMERDESTGIWREVDVPAFSPVLRKPNHFQTRIQFFRNWLISKLSHGNTYVLKKRDARNVVTGLYVLDPTRVKPLITEMGDVYYELRRDDLSRQEAETIVVPASEIIHDVMNPLHHPLLGVSPIFACGLVAMQGLNIQRASNKFFGNNAQPGGILTAPGEISDETATRLKAYWEANFTGENAGRTAVLGDGLTYVPMAVKPVDALVVEQQRLSAETICSAFHVPPYKVGVGPVPSYQNAEILNQIYYTDCLQILIEDVEALLDEGLSLPSQYGVEFDLDSLMRMDSSTLVTTLSNATKAGFMSPNEARARMNLPPVKGGEAPLSQQQNWSLEQLAERDMIPDKPSVAPPVEDEPKPDTSAEDEEAAKEFLALVNKGFAEDV